MNIDLKDVDVKLDTQRFMYIYMLHALYYFGFGPLVGVFSIFNGIHIYRNLGFLLNGGSQFARIVQLM